MASEELLATLLNGTAPRRARLLAAKGLLPLPPKDGLAVALVLLSDPDAELAECAGKTVAGYEDSDIVPMLEDSQCAPAVLEYFADKTPSETVLRAALINPALPSRAVEKLARTLPGSLLDTLLENRARILEAPAILQNLKENPALTPEVHRIIQEMEAEFFGGKKVDYLVEEAGAADAAEVQDLLLEMEAPPEELSLEGLPVDAGDREAALGQLLSKMSFRDKLRYAMFGNREIRTMLIRDSNKEVAKAVLRSPKLRDSEVEAISAMRGISDEILRLIGNSTQWTKSYGVVHSLVKNPKTPPMIAQRLIGRLRSSDLTLLSRDRSLTDAVRHHAVRTLKQRTPAARSSQ